MYSIIKLSVSTRGTVTAMGRNPASHWPRWTMLGRVPSIAAGRAKFAGQAERIEIARRALPSDVNPFTGARKGEHYMAPGTRDSQRAKVYRAESVLDRAPYNVNVRDLDKAQAIVDRWARAAWFVRRWGKVRITVTHNGGKRGSRAGGDTMHMATYNRTPFILAHELAHCLAPQGVGHGPAYARTYLDLVRFALGKDAYDRLAASFRMHKVKVAPRKTVCDRRGVVGTRATPARRGNPAALAAWRAARAALDETHDIAFALAKAARPAPIRARDIALALANGA